MQFSEMSDKELIDMAEGLHECIYVTECFGMSDLRNYDGATKELQLRGYSLTTRLVASKIEDEEEEEDE